MILKPISYTVWLKWIATLCSRYVSPPPLWEQFSSSFRFVQFSHWTVQIWKMTKKELKNDILIYEIFTLFSSFGQKNVWSKSTDYLTVSIFGLLFFRWGYNSVRAFLLIGLKWVVLRTLPPCFFVIGDCTRNHIVKKYNSYGVNFWQKSLVYQERISRIILRNFLFLANCIVRNQQL